MIGEHEEFEQAAETGGFPSVPGFPATTTTTATTSSSSSTTHLERMANIGAEDIAYLAVTVTLGLVVAFLLQLALRRRAPILLMGAVGAGGAAADALYAALYLAPPAGSSPSTTRPFGLDAGIRAGRHIVHGTARLLSLLHHALTTGRLFYLLAVSLLALAAAALCLEGVLPRVATVARGLMRRVGRRGEEGEAVEDLIEMQAARDRQQAEAATLAAEAAAALRRRQLAEAMESERALAKGGWIHDYGEKEGQRVGTRTSEADTAAVPRLTEQRPQAERPQPQPQPAAAASTEARRQAVAKKQEEIDRRIRERALAMERAEQEARALVEARQQRLYDARREVFRLKKEEQACTASLRDIRARHHRTAMQLRYGALADPQQQMQVQQEANELHQQVVHKEGELVTLSQSLAVVQEELLVAESAQTLASTSARTRTL
eukprot:jgi/Chlat1/5370/Chrsp35S05214